MKRGVGQNAKLHNSCKKRTQKKHATTPGLLIEMRSHLLFAQARIKPPPSLSPSPKGLDYRFEPLHTAWLSYNFKIWDHYVCFILTCLLVEQGLPIYFTRYTINTPFISLIFLNTSLTLACLHRHVPLCLAPKSGFVLFFGFFWKCSVYPRLSLNSQFCFGYWRAESTEGH